MNHPTAPSRLLLVDDSELVRRGLRSVLETRQAEFPHIVVGEAATAAAALDAVRRLKPDLVLLDIRLPDGSGLDVCREITRAHPAIGVVILTSFSSDQYIYDAVVAGARGYLMKEIDAAALVRGLRDVAAGRSILDAEATARVLRLLRAGGLNEPHQPLATLSAQERRVLALVADGLTNKEVGERLALSENTVKNYLVNVFEKLRVKRRAQAAALFVEQTRPPQD